MVCYRYVRVSLLVNIWVGHQPLIAPLPADVAARISVVNRSELLALRLRQIGLQDDQAGWLAARQASQWPEPRSRSHPYGSP